MKKLLYIFILFWIVCLSKAQSNPYSLVCATDNSSLSNKTNDFIAALGMNCGNTSQYYSNNDYTYSHYNLYSPQLSDDVIYLKVNFIFPTKPDGTGNFEQNNLEHNAILDEVIEQMNITLLNLGGQPGPACPGYGDNNLTNTKLQIVVNKVWKVDPAWDYLYTGFVPCTGQGAPGICTNFSKLTPGNGDYYYNYYNNDPTIPEGINIVFANNGYVYNEIINNHNYTAPGGQGWAISQNSSNSDFTQKLSEFFPDIFNDYLTKKYYIADNPDPNSPFPNTPWSVVRSWIRYGLSGGLLHETGHCFNLDHQNQCNVHIMDQHYTSSRNYLSNQEISKIYLAASTKSVRRYFTEDSFKNTNINVTNNELWDLNFRLYSNVKIDDNSSLKATCKIIMAPDSRFIVKDGSNFIIEGADITSANNATWNGIKVEGNGYLLINPNTLIDTNHFYAYADNTPLPNGKINSNSNVDRINKEIIENTIVDKDYRIYPNPTGDFINIETKNKISKVEVYNLLNKSFSPRYKDNQVDVRSLPQGNYILKIYSGSETKTIHFIKK